MKTVMYNYTGRKSFFTEPLCGVCMYSGSVGVKYEWVVLFGYALLYDVLQYVASCEIEGAERLQSLFNSFTESRGN